MASKKGIRKRLQDTLQDIKEDPYYVGGKRGKVAIHYLYGGINEAVVTYDLSRDRYTVAWRNGVSTSGTKSVIVNKVIREIERRHWRKTMVQVFVFASRD